MSNEEVKERRLERLYPWVEWDKPVRMEIVGKKKGFGCRYCIAMHGYVPAENKMPGFSEDRGEVVEHIKQQHLPKEEK